MKRRIAIVLIFLLLGAIVNVAVAWGCILSLPITFGWTAGDDDSALVIEAGLPIRALRGHYLLRGQGEFVNDLWVVRTKQGGPATLRYSLPLHPIWLGFAINTLFYAVILWLVFALPGALRRWRRIKRGLCPACAYPVGTSPVCTECGKPVRGRRGSTGQASTT